MWTLMTALAAAESIHDTELGLRLEVPVAASETITETGAGKDRGDSRLHLGWEGTFAYAVNPHLFFTGLVGSRRAYIAYEAEGDNSPWVETRAARLMLGAKYSFTAPPTFPYVAVHGGYVGSFWRVSVKAASGDRIARGLGAALSVGVDHFLTPRVAANLEARAWAERGGEDQIAFESWVFEAPPSRMGFSVLAGVVYR